MVLSLRKYAAIGLLVIVSLLVVACDSGETQVSALSVTQPAEERVELATVDATAAPPSRTPTPTITPTFTLTPTFTITPSPTSTPTITPSITPSPTLTVTPSPTLTPTLTHTPTFTPSPTLSPTPTYTPTPEPFVDHYSLFRPIGPNGVDFVDRTYPYGGTQRGTYQIHSGVEFFNSRFTPVLAADDGEVYYAGTDFDEQNMFGPFTNYYGNLVVIDHGYRLPEGDRLFSLYGHLEDIDVATGQSVEPGQPIGRVGATGIAQGAHLHFEVRVGDPYNFFESTRNPDLYILPKDDTGMLVGLVTDPEGNPVPEVPILLRRAGTRGQALYETYSYGGSPTQSSPMWNENFTRGDIRPGEYEVYVQTFRGQTVFRQDVTITAANAAYIQFEIPAGLEFYPDLNAFDLDDAQEYSTLTPTPGPEPEIAPESTEENRSVG